MNGKLTAIRGWNEKPSTCIQPAFESLAAIRTLGEPQAESLGHAGNCLLFYDRARDFIRLVKILPGNADCAAAPHANSPDQVCVAKSHRAL